MPLENVKPQFPLVRTLSQDCTVRYEVLHWAVTSDMTLPFILYSHEPNHGDFSHSDDKD